MRCQPPVRTLRRLGFLLLLSSIASLASAQYTTYQIYVNDAAIPAGVRGFASGGVVNDPPAGSAAPFNICFYTGFGSTAPIVPTGYVNQGDYATFNYAIPISTIQDVPNTSFSKGLFTAVVYTIPTSFKSCTGVGQSLGNSANVTLNYPIVTGVSLPAVPAQNPALATRLPSSLAIFGSYFISMRGSNPHSPSTVDFVSSNTVPATDRFVSSGSLVSTIPTTLPATQRPLSVKVCNTSVYSYCGSSPTIKVLPLQADSGTLTATPTATTPAQPVTLAASFGPATPTVAGAPSGLVTFYDGGTALGSAPLVLDTTATFVAAPAQSLTVSTAPIAPIVADFNTDGIPDILVVDPGTATQTASLHLLLGSVPSGSFAPDVPISVLSDGSSFQILSAAVADFNADGIPDIAVLAVDTSSAAAQPALYTLLGNGDGSFQNGFIAYSANPLFSNVRIAAGDFNHDGKADLVLAGTLESDGTTGLQPLLGDGTGNFTAGPVTLASAGPSDGFKLSVADFNGDGYPDIAILNGAAASGSVDASVEVYQNTGTAAFLAPVRVQTDATATANFFAAPLGPGQPPAILVTSSASNPGVAVALNQSTTAQIAFSANTPTTAVPGLTQAVAADFNGDGLLDLAVSDGSSIHVLNGAGDGTFSAVDTGLGFAPPANCTLVAASDQNGDTYADLLLLTAGTPAANSITLGLTAYVTAGTSTAALQNLSFNAGSHTLTAVTNGTYQILGTTAATSLVSTAITPMVAIAALSSSPASYGHPPTLVATIPDPTATGTVSFMNGSSLLGMAPLVDGSAAVATFTPVNLPAGNYAFVAVYSGDINHTAATSAPLAVQVLPVQATISWVPNPATIAYGTALSAAQLDATAIGVSGIAVAGSFSYSTAAGTVLPAGQHTITATFTPSDANYTAATASQTINVSQATPAVVWTPAVSTITYGTPLSAAQLDATSTIPGTFVYTPALGTLLTAGTQTLKAVFTPTDSVDFNSVTATTSIIVDAATPAVAWMPSPSTIAYGTTLSAAQLDAASSTPGTFVYTPALGTLLTAGTQTLKAVFTPTDSVDFNSVTATTNLVVTPATPTLTWTPTPATITYGTGLSAAQLDAASSTPGTFSYTPAAGTVLTVGPQTITAVFTPADTVDYTAATTTATIAVTQATPVISWATPPGILPGTALSAAQLNATATGANGSALPGTFVYAPPLGTVLPSGIQKLSVVFTPTDTADYTTASASVPIAVELFSLASLSSTVAVLGDPAKTITVTGTGFAATAVVQMGTTPIPTTFVSSTTLTAVIPASDFQTVQTIQLSVADPVLNLSSAPVPFYVVAPIASVLFAGPNATVPAAQTSVNFQLTNPYPVDLAANFGLTFTPAAGLPADPSVMFSNGGDSYTVVIPANTTASPTVQFQTGTVAGTATVSLSMVAGGTNVTPSSVKPINIASPFTVPGITSVSASASGETLTVTVRGFSNNRQMNQAKFHFTPVAGKSIATPDVTLNVDSIFATWYADSASGQYGSEFTYTQTFNLSSDASVVGEVTVTLANSLGTSPEAMTP
jgi:hypothetical protein